MPPHTKMEEASCRAVSAVRRRDLHADLLNDSPAGDSARPWRCTASITRPTLGRISNRAASFG